MTTRVSLAELAGADIKLRPAEAVAIVATICRQRLGGALPGIPTPGVIRVTRDGGVVIEGPVAKTGEDVARAAHLLDALLPGFDALPEYRASGALRLVIARALRTLDLPPFASLEELCDALGRFSAPDPRQSIAGLLGAWTRVGAARARRDAQPTELTISDVRRARRATGLSLDHVAAVAELPRTRVRALEWGDLREWPPSPAGRTHIIRYARAAGLDEMLVLSIAWPLVLETAHLRPAVAETSTALVPAAPRTIATIESTVVTANRGRRWRAAAGAIAAAILLGVGLGSLGSDNPPSPAPPAATRAAAVQIGTQRTAAPPVVIVPREARPEPNSPRVVRASTARKRPTARAAAPEGRKTPVLQRELFRIEFK